MRQHKLRKLIEYRISWVDGNIDHTNWREAKKLLGKPTGDIKSISRVTRWWHDDGELEREREEFLFERGDR